MHTPRCTTRTSHRTHSSFHGGRPTQAYEAILAYLVHNGWYFIVEMNSGKMVLPYFDALSAFWPGLQVPPVVCLSLVWSHQLRWRSVADVSGRHGSQVLLGDVSGAIESVTGFVKVWAFFGFTPEKANLINGALLEGQKRYPPHTHTYHRTRHDTTRTTAHAHALPHTRHDTTRA